CRERSPAVRFAVISTIPKQGGAGRRLVSSVQVDTGSIERGPAMLIGSQYRRRGPLELGAIRRPPARRAPTRCGGKTDVQAKQSVFATMQLEAGPLAKSRSHSSRMTSLASANGVGEMSKPGPLGS